MVDFWVRLFYRLIENTCISIQYLNILDVESISLSLNHHKFRYLAEYISPKQIYLEYVGETFTSKAQLLKIDRDRLVFGLLQLIGCLPLTLAYNANCNRTGKGQKSSLNLD